MATTIAVLYMVPHRHQIFVLNVMATTIIVFNIIFLCSTGTKIYYLYHDGHNHRSNYYLCSTGTKSAVLNTVATTTPVYYTQLCAPAAQCDGQNHRCFYYLCSTGTESAVLNTVATTTPVYYTQFCAPAAQCVGQTISSITICAPQALNLLF